MIYDRGLNGDNHGYGIALDSSGHVLVAGDSAGAANDDMALWRYTEAGVLDTTFGTGGVVFNDDAAGGSGDDVAYGLAIDSNGMIVLSGESAGAADKDIVVWRFTDTGALGHGLQRRRNSNIRWWTWGRWCAEGSHGLL